MLFTSRSSGPLRCWGETTKYQFNHVRAVTALCVPVDATFLGRKRVGVSVHQSTEKDNVASLAFSELAEVHDGHLNCAKVEDLVNSIARNLDSLLQRTTQPSTKQSSFQTVAVKYQLHQRREKQRHRVQSRTPPGSHRRLEATTCRLAFTSSLR